MEVLNVCIPNPPLPVGYMPPRALDESFDGLASLVGVQPPQQLAALRDSYWGRKGVDLTVSFLDNPPAALRDKILKYANLWSLHANVRFRYTQGTGQVRIARSPKEGYYSYMGRGILGIPPNQKTMNLANFTLSTPDSEVMRVVPHEFGHTLGFAHEHLRAEIVNDIDRQAAYAYFQQTSGWSQRMVNEQVLKVLQQQAVISTAHAMRDSIMCYALPARIMKSRKAVVGGSTISQLDHDLCRKLYPLPL